MGVVADHPRAEAVAEEVAPATPADVEALRVHAVEPVHSGREIVSLSLEDPVVVRPEHRPGMELEAEAAAALLHHRYLGIAVLRIAEGDPETGAPGRDMPDAQTRQLLSRDPRHVFDGTWSVCGSGRACVFWHAFGTKL
jgi:hypothetical protein